MRWLLSLVVVMGGLLPNAPAQSLINPAPGYEAITVQLDALIRDQLLDKDIPCMSIALVDDQRIVWAKGFGYAHPSIERGADAETVYRVGSVSKLYTDVLTMQLVEQGKLDLDAPVSKYLRTFLPTNPYETPITLRQLMSHRAGLVRESPVGHYMDPDQVALSETVKSLNRTELVYEPGTRIKYSNAGIATVGHVVERTVKEPFAEYARKQLLEPLGMKSSSFALDERVTARFADSIMWTYHGRTFPSPVWDLSMPPAGSLYSTVIDQSQFLKMIFGDGTLNGVQVLKPETLREMTTLQFAKEGERSGFGIGFQISQLDGQLRIGHGGAVYGFATELAALPKHKLGVIVCASKDMANGVTSRVANQALRLMLATKTQQPLPRFEASRRLPAGLAKKLAGRYQLNDRHFDLIARDQRLWLLPGVGGFKTELKWLGDRLIIDDVLIYGDVLTPVENQQIRYRDENWKRVEVPVPAEPKDEWRGLIGEYGWDHNILTILEKDGQLHALIEWAFLYPLTQIDANTYAFPDFGLYHGEKLRFTRDLTGKASSVEAAQIVFNRRNRASEDGSTFRIKAVKPVDQLRKLALAATPPKENRQFRKPDLVDLSTLDPTFQFDIRYANDNNFLGTPVYTLPKAYLQRPAAEALVKVNAELKPKGYGLLIHDGYRPWYVTKIFFDATPEYMQEFVADPSKGSRHNRGCAIDLTLYELSTGKPVQMVSGFDEFSDRSYPDYLGGTSRQRWYQELLRDTMEAHGFQAIDNEWWHFDYRDWRAYPIINVTFEELMKAR